MFEDKKFFNLLHIYEEEQLDFQDNVSGPVCWVLIWFGISLRGRRKTENCWLL